MRIDKTQIFFKQSSLHPLIYGRVINIFLNPNNEQDVKSFSTIYSGNSGIGAIEFELVNNVNNLTKGYAKPFFPQNKYYPLINEIVLLVVGPSYDTPEDSNSNELYYLNSFNTYNSPHINPQPIVIENKIKNSSKPNVEFGDTFKEKSNIQSLLPFEGDYILEGRWGNSLRFGSTISGSKNNQWSNNEEGNPITIIRNGQTFNSGSIDFTIEDINTDSTSIWMTDGQEIPINVASFNLDTFNIQLNQEKINPIFIPNVDIVSDSTYDNTD